MSKTVKIRKLFECFLKRDGYEIIPFEENLEKLIINWKNYDKEE